MESTKKITWADIKSKRTKAYVQGIVSDPNSQIAQNADYVVADIFLPRLIYTNEQEARERARTAFCKSCQSKDCHEEGECDRVADFLKHYDKD